MRLLILFSALVLSLSTHLNAQAVRILNGNVCGSGTVCGSDAQSTYILTNAHVVGTRVGQSVLVRQESVGSYVEYNATVLVAAYSDRLITDWAILRTPKRQGPEWKLSKQRPTEKQYRTCGSPRCVWPLVCSVVTSVDVGGTGSPWRWTPNSIGGQSGSSVRNDRAVYGLLTWSWGGRGAGQLTSVIYRQMQERSNNAGERPAGLREVGFADRHETENGYFEGERSEQIALPIWIDDVAPPPPPPPPPKPDCPPCPPCPICHGAGELAIPPANWARIIELILELIRLFRS